MGLVVAQMKYELQGCADVVRCVRSLTPNVSLGEINKI